jgi:transcriptional regulator with XRE-family HTH domain
MEENRTFGNTLKTFREAAKIGSKQLSRMVDKSEAYVSQVENGRNKNPDYETAFKLMECLGHPKHEIKDFLEFYDIRPVDSIMEMKLREDKNKSTNWRYELKFEKSQLKLMKLKQELKLFLDHDFSKAERVINNLYGLIYGNDEVFNFFTSLLEADYTQLNKVQRQSILDHIESISRKDEE